MKIVVIVMIIIIIIIITIINNNKCPSLVIKNKPNEHVLDLIPEVMDDDLFQSFTESLLFFCKL